MPEAPISLNEIRDRAYELWERNHRPEGMEIELWLMAERELRAEREARRRLAQEGGRAAEPDPQSGRAEATRRRTPVPKAS